MKTYLYLQSAADKYDISPDKLRQLAEENKIRSGLLEGELILLEKDVAEQAAELFVSREQFEHLEGVPIRVSEAARKYDILAPTIARWAQRGKIKTLSREQSKTTVNEADVAYEAARLKIKQK